MTNDQPKGQAKQLPPKPPPFREQMKGMRDFYETHHYDLPPGALPQETTQPQPANGSNAALKKAVKAKKKGKK
jgi:hypothetical protein